MKYISPQTHSTPSRISETAHRNREELFPNHVCTVAATDPELIETFDNFAFDEILRACKLDVRTRLMIQLASIIASQAVREYRAAPYVGMAKAFDFIHATNDVLTERGVKLPFPGSPSRRQKHAWRRALQSGSRSQAAMSSKSSVHLHPPTKCAFSTCCRPIASATTTRAVALTCRRAN
jgi:hypothetical protein